MSLSIDDLNQIRTIVREEVKAAAVVVPVEEDDPLPQWTMPDPLHVPYTELGDSKDYAECRRRALYGIGWRGNHFLSGKWLDAAWVEVEKVKALTDVTVKTYRDGLYSTLHPDFACYCVLQGFLWTPEYQKTQLLTPMTAPNLDWDSSTTPESYLDSQWGITGTPGYGR